MDDKKTDNDNIMDLFKGSVTINENNGEFKYCIGVRKAWIYVTESQLHDIHMGIHEVLKTLGA
jgi:hypothetical protein